MTREAACRVRPGNVRAATLKASLLLAAPVALACTPLVARAQCGAWDNHFSVPGSFDSDVDALTTWDPDGNGPQIAQLVAGGIFESAGSLTLNCIARWDGSAWQPFGTGMDEFFVSALTTWDPDGEGPQTAQLVAGGSLRTVGGVTVNGIARWDGAAWQPFANGFQVTNLIPTVYSLTTWDPDGAGPQPAQLVAGGNFLVASGVGVNRIARWDGSAWQPLGNGMTGAGAPWVLALTTWDPDGNGPQTARLVAGGGFATAGTTTVNYIASWNGSAWQAFGTGMNSPVHSLTTWDPDGAGPQPAHLVAGGNFTRAGGLVRNRIARWDGSAWQPFGTGMNEAVASLETWDPDGDGPQTTQIVAGGMFGLAGGAVMSRIARWDGSAWRSFGSGVGGAQVPTVSATKSWDPDAGGPQPAQLVAGGTFTTAGGIPAPYIAMWSTLPPSIANQPDDLSACRGGTAMFSVAASNPDTLSYRWRFNQTPLDDTDRISGSFTDTLAISNLSASDVGAYDCVVTNECGSTTSDAATLTVCASDFDCDGFVTGIDFDLFVQAFETGDMNADFDGDGFITGIDFDLYVVAFEAGC
jgi:hypothetical protein